MGKRDHFSDRGKQGLPGRPTAQQLQRCEMAIEVLMDTHCVWPGTKEQFAIKMGWPSKTHVEEVARITKDQDLWPDVHAQLGGYIIAYAPGEGGMILIAPDGDMPLHHYVHVLLGDLQRQKQHRTENRRRLPTWQAAGDKAVMNDDRELAQLCYSAHNEIEKNGNVTDGILHKMFQALIARGAA